MTSRIAASSPSPERSGRPAARVQQQRRLVPHQLAAPYAVGCAADRADVVTPDLGRREVGLALVEWVEQAQDRLVFDSLEPLPGCGDWLVVGRYWKNSPGSPATPVALSDSTSSVLPLRCDASTRYAEAAIAFA